MDKRTHMQMSNSHKIGIIIILSLAVWGGVNYYSDVMYKLYFKESQRTIAITSSMIYGGTTAMTLSYSYYYRVKGITYKGNYSIPKDSNVKRIKYPEHKYLVIYSNKNPAYHVFLPIEVTKENYINIEIDDAQVKDDFLLPNNKAKIIKK